MAGLSRNQACRPSGGALRIRLDLRSRGGGERGQLAPSPIRTRSIRGGGRRPRGRHRRGGPSEFSGAATLTALWVDPRFRSQGVGTALVEAVLDWARGEGFSQVLLWVTEMNEKAERLYERHGFARSGRVIEVRPREPALEYEMTKVL